MICNKCNAEMQVIKTTGKLYKHYCFTCGHVEIEDRNPKLPWYKRLFR